MYTFLRIVFVSTALIVFSGCSHPLEVVGQGDIASATGSRDCSLENQPCANYVVNGYIETYTAVPRLGWQFKTWEGCINQDPLKDTCSFYVDSRDVRENWFKTMPALRAIFEKGPEVDSDGDGVVDSIDEDDDNDGVLDIDDAFPLDPFESSDSDDDGTGDNADLDDDNDGVPDEDDAFPLDPDETSDFDNDGTGDVADTDDDNDGVDDVLDEAPFNAACSSLDDSEGGVCYVELMAAFDKLLISPEGVVHAIVFSEKRIYRWDSVNSEFLAPVDVGLIPASGELISAAASLEHGRLYLGFDTGQVTYWNSVEGEVWFATVAEAVRGLASAGNYLMVQDASGAWETHYYFDELGLQTEAKDWNHFSTAYYWHEADSRLYFFRDTSSPNDIHYEELSAEGLIVNDGESPYHGDYVIRGPIVVAPTDDLLMIGSGNIFNLPDLTWAGAIVGGIADAKWTEDGLIVLRAVSGSTQLDRVSGSLTNAESLFLDGEPGALFKVDTGYLVVTRHEGNLNFSFYTPSDDSDSDGVDNSDDAFPLDIAASVDTDNDDYPDYWNLGYDETDSSTGLMLDAYPYDSACYLIEHGNGVDCDVAATLPNYVADKIADEAPVAYLLSTDNRRVYRYSLDDGHLSPIIVGTPGPLNVTSPTIMEFVPAHNRLYLGYDSGRVTFVDLSDSFLTEQEFVTQGDTVLGIGAAGDFVMIVDPSGAWESHYYYDSSGELTSSAEWNRRSNDFAWNQTLSRLLFFRDGTSPNDIEWEDIDSQGNILSEGDSPYHGTYSIRPPIIVSPDDSQVIIGTGDYYNAGSLVWDESIGADFIDGAWEVSDELVVIRESGVNTAAYRYSDPSTIEETETFIGEPVSVLFVEQGRYLVVTQGESGPAFHEFLIE